ncbi:hypothetical protein H4R33_003921 [Dimargaris cristalligena]|nr:hypothetical protein H4R33_003921 [Dimargaris cristalligena]
MGQDRSPSSRRERKEHRSHRKDRKRDDRHGHRDRDRSESERHSKDKRRKKDDSPPPAEPVDLDSFWVEKTPSAPPAPTEPSAQVVTLPNFDDQGRPLNLDQEPLLQHLKAGTSETKAQRRRPVSVLDEGKDTDIMTMLHQEKYANSQSTDRQMAKRILRDAKFKASGGN